MSYAPYSTSPTEALNLQAVMTRVYAWMTAGLLATGAIAFFVANTGLAAILISSPIIYFGLFIVELIIVFVLASRIEKMSAGMATGMFMGYSLLNGLTLSLIFLVYTTESIASTFLITGVTFGVMSLYGYTTKQDLSKIGNILFMALIGFLIASVVNIFLRSEALYWIVTYAGILIFVGLTAWDTQKIKRMSMNIASNDEVNIQRLAILGALMLYLDFINLFLLLLRVLGNRD
ncbi:MAG: Bax inhibitor-1/YccA family protein [Chloroflexaceae bacterium]